MTNHQLRTAYLSDSDFHLHLPIQNKTILSFIILHNLHEHDLFEWTKEFLETVVPFKWIKETSRTVEFSIETLI
jgi:hypothetical protein